MDFNELADKLYRAFALRESLETDRRAANESGARSWDYFARNQIQEADDAATEAQQALDAYIDERVKQALERLTQPKG